MVNLKRASFGGNIYSEFLTPIPFSKEGIDRFTLSALQALQDFGLRMEHAQLRPGDILFDYDLTLHLFNRTASLRFSADGLRLAFNTARGADDLRIIRGVIDAIYSLIPAEQFQMHDCHAFVHAEAVDEFAKERLSHSGDFSFMGALARYTPSCDWDGDVRVTIDKSFSLDHGAFLTYSSISKLPINEDNVRLCLEAFAEATEALGFAIATES